MPLKSDPHVALVTCSNLPSLEVDDRPLFSELERRGVRLSHPTWDDPDFAWEHCDLVIPRTTWDYQEQADIFLQWMKHVDGCTHLLNPIALMEWNINKRYLDALKIDTPPTIWLDKVGSPTNLPNVVEVCKERGWTKGFLKPTIGACAWGTLRFDVHHPNASADIETHLIEWLTQGDMILQPYNERVERDGEYSLIYFDHQFSHGVQKIPVAGDYRVQDDYGAKDYPWSPPQSWISVAENMLNSLDHRALYARCDFLRDDHDQPQLIELELIEPSLFFRHSTKSASMFADVIIEAVSKNKR